MGTGEKYSCLRSPGGVQVYSTMHGGQRASEAGGGSGVFLWKEDARQTRARQFRPKLGYKVLSAGGAQVDNAPFARSVSERIEFAVPIPGNVDNTIDVLTTHNR